MFVIAILGGLALYTLRQTPINGSWRFENDHLRKQDDIYERLCESAAKIAYLPRIGTIFNNIIYVEVDPKDRSLCYIQDAEIYPVEISGELQFPSCIPISDDEKRLLSREVNITAKPFEQIGKELNACFTISVIDP